MRPDTVDVHTHVFNLRYLPLEGIVMARLPRLLPFKRTIAAALGKLLNAITHDGSGLGAPPPIARPEAAALGRRDADAILAELASEAPPELRFDAEVREGIVLSRGAMPEAAGAAEAAPANDFAALLSKLKLLNVDGIFETIDDFINWIGFLRHDETYIMNRLFETYPVDLYVHHMMDMEHYYNPGKCFYKFNAEQIRRMRRLVELSGGKLLTFIAWSPSRDAQERLALVKDAVLTGGAAGVKIYPPSGYPADDARNDELWQFCVDEDVPVFTHCNSTGFYAKRDYTKFNNPRYWANVLAKFPKLRLCFGHAGGAAGWFDRYSKKKNDPEKNWETSFAKAIFDLCVQHDHVYCETGFLPEVLDNAKPFIDRLTACFLAEPKFATRLLYGTDWHMIERIEAHTQYFEACEAMFEHPVLDQYKDLFFYANAVEYLNLPAYESRQVRPESFDMDAVKPHLRMVQEKAARMRARVPRP